MKHLSVAAVGTLAVGFLMSVRQWPGMHYPAVIGALATAYFYIHMAMGQENRGVETWARHGMVGFFILAVPLRAFGLNIGLAFMLASALAFFVWLASMLAKGQKA